MEIRDLIEIELCTDCLMIAANGAETEELAAIEWPGIDEGYTVSPGHLHTLEDCGADVMAGTADCPFDEGSFSWSSCDACRRPQGGDRYPASMFRIETAALSPDGVIRSDDSDRWTP